MSRTDVHHHVVSDTYRAALARVGVEHVGGVPLPPWSLDQTYERMGALAVDRALLSVSAPGVAVGPAAERPAIARDLNAELAALRDADPGRLGFLATLPLPDVDGSLAVIADAYDGHRADGVLALTQSDGVFLSDPRLDPVLAELDHRRALVLVHPAVPDVSALLGMVLPPPLLEFTFDTTRVAADMLLRGTLDRFPHVRFVLSHLGGTLPWLAHRLSMIEAVPLGPWARFAEPGGSVREQLRRFWYDTAMSAGPEQLRLATDLVGADRLVYGSDTTFGPPAFVERTTALLDRLPAEHRRLVDEGVTRAAAASG